MWDPWKSFQAKEMAGLASRADSTGLALASVGLPATTLNRDALAGQNLVLQGVQASRRLVDLPRERDGSGQDREQPLLVLDAGLRVLVLHHQVRPGDIQREQLAGGELVVQPVHGAVLEVSQRVVAPGAGEVVLAEYRL